MTRCGIMMCDQDGRMDKQFYRYGYYGRYDDEDEDEDDEDDEL